MIAIISKFINKLQLSNILLVKLTRFTVDDKFSHQSKQKRSPLITYLIIHLTNKLIHYNEVDSLNNLKEESSDEFLAFGYPCKLFDSRGGRDCADESADLIPLHCNRKILVDRIMSLFGYQMDFIKEFDCRLQLSNLEKYDASKVEQSLLIADRSLEALLDAERYRDFKLTCETPKVENEKRMGTEIYFNYDDLESKPQHGCQPKEEAEGTEDEQKEQFVPPAELKVPVGVTMPKTVKEGIIIEKTAAFIAEQGSQMEIIVNAKQKSNPQFRFLDWNHPLNKYYKHVLKMIKEKRYTPVVVKKDPAPESESDSDDSSEHYLHPSLMGGAGKTAVAKDTEPLSLPKTSYRLGEENDVYSELFNGLVAVCPQLAAAVSTAKGKETGGSAEGLLLPPPPDLYPVVDRVAAYVARNGPQFEQILRERNDPRFSFIDPSNKYNPYYMALLQNYESENCIARLQQNVQNQFVEGVPMSLNYLSYYGFVPQPPPPPRSTPPPPAVENQEETLNLKKTKTVYSSDHLTSAAASSSVSEKKPTEMGSVGPVCFTIKAKNQEETCSMVDKANLDAHQDETINLSLQSDSDVLMSDCAEKFDCKFVDGSGDGTESTVKSVDEYMRREITAFPEVGKKEQKNVEEDLNLKRARRYRAKKFVDEFAKKIRKREKSCVDEEKVKKHGHISEGELCDSESSESTLIGPSSNACYGSEKKKKKKKKKEEESKGRLMNFDKLPLSYAKCMKLNERSRSRRRRRSKSSSHSRHRRSTEDRRRRRSRSRKRTSRSRSSRSTTSTRRYYSSRHRRSRSIAKMFVDQPEQLKNWLINTLSPLYHLKLYTKHLVVIEFLCSRCDADPAALAKYVMALLKKDKAEADLKHFCLDQLDVFLQKETKKFVDELFLALKSKVYIVTDKESQSTSTKEVPKKRSLEPSRNEKPSADEHLKSRRVDSHSGSRPVRRYGSSPKARSKSSERSKGKGDATSISQNKASSSTVRDRVKAHWSPSNNKEQRKSTHKDSNEAVGNAENDSVQSIRSEKEKRKKARCRDYDEKGYCMLGDNCVYDHGPDPVVVEDVALSSMIPKLPVKSSSNGTSSHEEAIFKAETNATAANAGSDTVSTTMNKMDGDAFATKSVRLVHNADAEVKNPVANVAASKGENTKRILKKRLELQRAETELFNRQLEQEKLLLKKLEDCKDQTTKELIIKTLKKLEISLMATKKNLESRDFSKFVKRSKTEVQRDVLDAELELITKKKAGEDITEIAVRLQNLRKEMQHLNDTESNNKHCRNSAYRPERNRRIPRSAVLDLRSRSILITDFCMEHKDALIEHLQQFGTLRDIDFYPLTDPAVGKVIASFYDRKEAERAFTDGKLFKDQLLNMTWAVEDKDAMAAALSAGSKSDLSAKALLKTLDPPDDDDDDDDDLFEENEREEVEEEEQQLA
ncbi:Protein SWAP [Trichinella spiralis]|uniref:Protein SWAP n=1 Tax=Trichinella spiralis TaxID=6334 RepID=A0A0V1B7A1_TRISP|nr:Protein SWAP [Trichinella spiralis]